MPEVKIDKGIPAPRPNPRGGRRPKYPWYAMQVGDSMLLDGKPGNARAHAYRVAIQYGYKFTTESEGKKVRVWRIQ